MTRYSPRSMRRKQRGSATLVGVAIGVLCSVAAFITVFLLDCSDL
jgi:hypothetical protein